MAKRRSSFSESAMLLATERICARTTETRASIKTQVKSLADSLSGTSNYVSDLQQHGMLESLWFCHNRPSPNPSTFSPSSVLGAKFELLKRENLPQDTIWKLLDDIAEKYSALAELVSIKNQLGLLLALYHGLHGRERFRKSRTIQHATDLESEDSYAKIMDSAFATEQPPNPKNYRPDWKLDDILRKMPIELRDFLTNMTSFFAGTVTDEELAILSGRTIEAWRTHKCRMFKAVRDHLGQSPE
jgi:hypothetical protein